jgi:sortase B
MTDLKNHSEVNKLPELLSPVGGRAQLEAAVNHGADAVYMGGSLFNARINAENFTEESLAEAIDFAHERGVKVYITFNTLYARHTYEIFAVLITNARRDQGFPYHRFIDAETAEDFEEFITDCQSLSLYDTGITPVYGDKLITLSTCEYSQKVGRFVVVAKQID